jgi:hypothetical protein
MKALGFDETHNFVSDPQRERSLPFPELEHDCSVSDSLNSEPRGTHSRLPQKVFDAAEHFFIAWYRHTAVMIYFQCARKGSLEIYQLPSSGHVGYFQHMTREERKAGTTARAKSLYERLMALPRPEGLSNNEWAKRAGVNTSFFTNVRNGSEPSVGNLRSVLEAIGVTLPEFFLDEAPECVVLAPSERELTEALRDALPGLPRSPERRAEYLAEVVLSVLALPKHHSAISEAHSHLRADAHTETKVHAATS